MTVAVSLPWSSLSSMATSAPGQSSKGGVEKGTRAAALGAKAPVASRQACCAAYTAMAALRLGHSA